MTGAGRRRLLVEADGGSRGNPGVAGYGALVRDRDDQAVLVELAEPLGRASNNVAEYSGLIAGLRAVLDIDEGADVEVRMDSKLVIEQMSGRWKIKHEDMRRLALQARELCSRISAAGGSVDFTWVRREQNKAADALSNEGMDGHHVHRDHRDERSDDPEHREHTEDRAGESSQEIAPPTGLRLLLVQVPHDETHMEAIAAGARELLGPDARVTAPDSPLPAKVARGIAEELGIEVSMSDAWAGPSGGEGADERVTAAYRSLLEKGGTVVAVTTRRGVLTVLAEVLGLAPDRFWSIATAPGSLSAVEVWHDGAASVAFTNRTSHLR